MKGQTYMSHAQLEYKRNLPTQAQRDPDANMFYLPEEAHFMAKTIMQMRNGDDA